MTKPKYIKYQCRECPVPCNYFYEPAKGKTENNYFPPVACLCCVKQPVWKRVERFTKNGI